MSVTTQLTTGLSKAPPEHMFSHSTSLYPAGIPGCHVPAMGLPIPWQLEGGLACAPQKGPLWLGTNGPASAPESLKSAPQQAELQETSPSDFSLGSSDTRPTGAVVRNTTAGGQGRGTPRSLKADQHRGKHATVRLRNGDIKTVCPREGSTLILG